MDAARFALESPPADGVSFVPSASPAIPRALRDVPLHLEDVLEPHRGTGPADTHTGAPQPDIYQLWLQPLNAAAPPCFCRARSQPGHR